MAAIDFKAHVICHPPLEGAVEMLALRIDGKEMTILGNEIPVSNGKNTQKGNEMRRYMHICKECDGDHETMTD